MVLITVFSPGYSRLEIIRLKVPAYQYQGKKKT